jgi:hypothetical protein
MKVVRPTKHEKNVEESQALGGDIIKILSDDGWLKNYQLATIAEQLFKTGCTNGTNTFKLAHLNKLPGSIMYTMKVVFNLSIPMLDQVKQDINKKSHLFYFINLVTIRR